MKNAAHRVFVSTVCMLWSGGLATGLLSGTALAGDRADAKSEKDQSIAVVELFTSEACPSCPPAEAYLKELVDKSRKTKQRVFPLTFHVDYWSSPGKKDPFSSEEFAERQHAYAKAMKLETVYTPQMIVNGTEEFVGSEKDKAQSAIKAALARPADVKVTLTVQQTHTGDKQPYSIEYETSTAPEETVVNLALVERGLKTGSAFRSRQHENVVRVFRKIALKSSGKHQLELSVPPGAVASNCSVIAYIQNTRTGAIVGAASVDLPRAPARQALNQPRE